MGRCFAKHSMTSSKVCSSVRTGAIAGVFTYATSKQMLSMVGGSLNLRRLKFKAIRDGIPLWRKLFDLLGLTLMGLQIDVVPDTPDARAADGIGVEGLKQGGDDLIQGPAGDGALLILWYLAGHR